MKINTVSNFNFKSRGVNELKKVIEISRIGGLSEQGVKVLLNEVKKVCPKKEDKVFFYFKKIYPDEHSWLPSTIRSGIRVDKDGKTMRLNIDPRKFQPRDLLQEMVMGVKKLVKGEVQSDEKLALFPTDKPAHNWTAFYYDKREPLKPWFKCYENSFKPKKTFF